MFLAHLFLDKNPLKRFVANFWPCMEISDKPSKSSIVPSTLKTIHHIPTTKNCHPPNKITIPKFNITPKKNDGWKTIYFPIGFLVTFQGRTVKLRGGYPNKKIFWTMPYVRMKPLTTSVKNSLHPRNSTLDTKK